MEIAELVEQVKSKEDFINFIQTLQSDLIKNREDWENTELESYLEAMEAYLTDANENSMNKVDFTPSWSLFARIMVAASIYE